MTDECHGEDPPKLAKLEQDDKEQWCFGGWRVAMIINAFERQQEIKELYHDDAYTILSLYMRVVGIKISDICYFGEKDHILQMDCDGKKVHTLE